MADFTADFEAGTNGNTITTGAGEASATAWDTVTLTPTYSNVQKAHGSLSALLDDNSSFLSWTSLSTADHYGRAYVYVTAVSGDRYFISGNMTGRAVAFFIGQTDANSGIYTIKDSVAGGHQVLSGNGTALLNQWVRVEYHVVCSATVGEVEAKFYTLDSTSPFVTLTSPASWNTDTATNEVHFGPSTGFGATFYMDDILANATSYPGPAGFESNQLRTVASPLRW